MSAFLGRWLRRGGWIPLLEFALVAAIAVVLARWTWLALTPPQTAASAFSRMAGERPTPVKRGLFGVAQEPTPAGDTGAAPLRLIGVLSHGATRGGWAVLASGSGKARAFGVGESVAPGIIVREIGADYAVLLRRGVPERLTLAGRRAADADARR